jgi:uroporphyrinogen-III synthase
VTLAGRVIAVTRPEDRTRALAAALEALGATVLACPAIEVAPPSSYDALDAALARLAEYDWLALTSTAAVDAVADRLAVLGVALGAGPRVAVVGAASAEAARARLGRCDLVPALQTADGLVAAWPRPAGARVLFPCADRARDALPVGLRGRGARVECVVAYRTLSTDGALDDVARRALGHGVDAVLLASPSAAQGLARALGRVGAPSPALVCIGPATAQACRDLGLAVASVAASPSDDGLVAAALACLSGEPSSRAQ